MVNMIKIIIWIIISLFVLFNLIMPFIVYRVMLVRRKKPDRIRKPTGIKTQKDIQIYEEGMIWIQENQSAQQEVEIINQGLVLRGKYFDFNFNKAVILVSGRKENCISSCYYAETFKNLGYNILAIDNRCSGFSEGIYMNIGLKEYSDILAWGKFLHNNKNNQVVICHGVCLGAATVLYAFSHEDCPDYMKALILDGLFPSFQDILKKHIKKCRQFTFPSSQIIMLLISLHANQNAYKKNPKNEVKKLQKPVLFIAGKEDLYSPAEKIQKMYQDCTAPKQIKLVTGTHAHLRLESKEEYDQAISEFLQKIFQSVQ